MSMAPVAAMTSGSALMRSRIQSIAWSGPAMKPSSDIALFTTTLPVPVLVSLTRFLAGLQRAGGTERRARPRSRRDYPRA